MEIIIVINFKISDLILLYTQINTTKVQELTELADPKFITV